MPHIITLTILAGFIAAALFGKIRNKERYLKGLRLFIAGAVLMIVVPQIFTIGPMAGIVTVPLGIILCFCCVYSLCGALLMGENEQHT